MTDAQQAAQSFAIDLARFRLTERAVEMANQRLEEVLDRVRQGVVHHLQVA